MTSPTASIVIPAHNEERAVRRLLASILGEAHPGEFELLVVCNGCTDSTVRSAQEFGDRVTVLDLPEPSKRKALKRGDEIATSFPRLYVDADVELSTVDVRALLHSLEQPGVLAAAPERELQRDQVSALVRAYYDVWERLPQVRSSLFGRGVIAVSEAGFDRIRDLPPVMADDLSTSLAFAATERVVVPGARVAIWPPRTMRGLLRRRVRVHTGTSQIEDSPDRPTPDTTSPNDLVAIIRHEPLMAPRVGVFLAVAIAAKLGSRRRVRRGDFDTWLRDDSRE